MPQPCFRCEYIGTRHSEEPCKSCTKFVKPEPQNGSLQQYGFKTVNIPTSFGARLKALRHRAGMTQKELAENTGCSVNAIHQWESNKRKPSRRMIFRLTNALNVDVSSLDVVSNKNNIGGCAAMPVYYRDRQSKNPYWERICKLSDKQRAKGMETYGQGIEDNPAAMLKRIEYLQEELVDALMYCEWIKDKLTELEGEQHDQD